MLYGDIRPPVLGRKIVSWRLNASRHRSKFVSRAGRRRRRVGGVRERRASLWRQPVIFGLGDAPWPPGKGESVLSLMRSAAGWQTDRSNSLRRSRWHACHSVSMQVERWHVAEPQTGPTSRSRGNRQREPKGNQR